MSALSAEDNNSNAMSAASVLETLSSCSDLLAAGQLELLTKAAKDLPSLAPSVTSWAPTTLHTLASAIRACSQHLAALCARDRSPNASDDETMLQCAAVRLVVLQFLSLVCNSEERAVAMSMGDGREDSVARVVVRDVLESPTTNFDLNSLRAACELLRNICVAGHRTAQYLLPTGAVPALLTAAIAKARDQNGAAAAAAAVRLLIEKGGAAARNVALELAAFISSILAMKLDKTHPFVRVELARAIALATPHIIAFAQQQPPPQPREEQTAEESMECEKKVSSSFGDGKGGGSVGTSSVGISSCCANDNDGNISSSDTATVSAISTTGNSAHRCDKDMGDLKQAVDGLHVSRSRPSHEEIRNSCTLLGNRKGVEYICFLLASQQPPLHAEALKALLSLRAGCSKSSDRNVLHIGTTVRLKGLAGRADLNGEIGAVESIDELSNRFVVTLKSGEGPFKLKEGNLENVAVDISDEQKPIPSVENSAMKVRFDSKDILAVDPMDVGALVAETTPLQNRLAELLALYNDRNDSRISQLIRALL